MTSGVKPKFTPEQDAEMIRLVGLYGYSGAADRMDGKTGINIEDRVKYLRKTKGMTIFVMKVHKSRGAKYSKEENALIVEKLPLIGYHELGLLMPNRTDFSIRSRVIALRKELGIPLKAASDLHRCGGKKGAKRKDKPKKKPELMGQEYRYTPKSTGRHERYMRGGVEK